MKIMTVVGTRPELIRLSVLIPKLDKISDHIFVYTNQNYDYNLSGIFFDQLGIREPNYWFPNKGYSIGQFLSSAFIEFETVLLDEKPDKLLVLGDTNSGLLSLVANKYGIPIYHMEAGNRCYDDRVPEETNRRIIDHVSTYNLPYTENSKNLLLAEGFDRTKVIKTGNPIAEVMANFQEEVNSSKIYEMLGLSSNEFVLLSTHRKENVDTKETLTSIINAVNDISSDKKVIFPVHPRTKDKLNNWNIQTADNVALIDPLGFFDFISLEKNAFTVILDSGTALEETCILGTPSITIRNSTERPEVFECGASILVGTNYDSIIGAYNSIKSGGWWKIPSDYLVSNVSDIVVNLLLGEA